MEKVWVVRVSRNEEYFGWRAKFARLAGMHITDRFDHRVHCFFTEEGAKDFIRKSIARDLGNNRLVTLKAGISNRKLKESDLREFNNIESYHYDYKGKRTTFYYSYNCYMIE